MQPYYVDAVFSVLCIQMILCDLYLHQDPASYAVMQALYPPPSPTSLFSPPLTLIVPLPGEQHGLQASV